MNKLKQKTTQSLLWNALDKIGMQGIAFILGMFTARLLTPKDFGLIGALAFFTVISNLLVESGFTATLIRRKENQHGDYTAAFIFNLLLSVAIYAIVYTAAPYIAAYLNMPELTALARVLFITVIINSLGIVPNIVLSRNLNFKQIAISNIVAILASAVITIYIAYLGHGYWALAIQLIAYNSIRVLWLNIFSQWKIFSIPNFSVIKEIFSFSIFLIIVSIINSSVKYAYNIIIGKRFDVVNLGYFSQSQKYQLIPTSILQSTVTQVALPVLSSINHDTPRQLLYLRKLVRITAFISLPVTIVLIIMAEPLISIFLSDKWLPSVPYFQLLMLSAIFFPIQSLLQNLLVAIGKKKLYLYMECTRNILIISSLLLLNDSIMQLLYGLLAATLISNTILFAYTHKAINYHFSHIIMDILPYLSLSIVIGAIIYFIPNYINNIYLSSSIQLIAAITIYFSTLKLLGSSVLNEAINLVKNRK